MAKKAEDGFGGFTKMQALILLSKRSRSGYEIIHEIGFMLGKKPSAGQIYPLLAKMRYAGHVKVVSTGARDKKVYALTEKGRTALRRMLEKADSIVEAVLANKLKECEHCDCVVYANPYVRECGGKRHYFCCESCAEHSECE